MTNNQVLLEHLITAFNSIPFNRMLGLELDNPDPKQIRMRFAMKPELIGNYYHGILHGGVISAVLDMAGGMAVMSYALEKYPDASPEELAQIVGKCSTIDLQISYVNPGKGQIFHASAELIKSGNVISFTRMALHNEQDRLIATASGTYLLR